MSEFRVEIPVIVSAHSSGLAKLEAELTKLYASAQRVSAAASSALSSMGSGAAAAGAGMQEAAVGAQQAAAGYAQAGAAAQQAGAEQATAANAAGAATEQLGQSAENAADQIQQIGNTAEQAGQEAANAFDKASGAADKFSQRMEKSEQSIRKMVGQKIQLALEAIDKVSPVLTKIKMSIKNIAQKAWKITVKLADFVTAPFRKIIDLIKSPLVMTLSLTGIGMGASSFVSTFKDFTSGMSNVKALSGATNEEFAQLTATAEELGATTKFTAAEAADGMQYLAMAGWKANDIIEAMPGLLDLAAAGATDLGTAADIVSDVMTAMGMSADQASRAADIFARTATGSNTTIANLGETLKYAAPAANAFGLSLSEAATITGMMANAGVKGSMAGTALRASLLEMASPSKKANEAMKALGLTFSDDTGKMKDMKTIVGDLSKAFGGLTDQQKLSYAEDLFGTRGSSAWLSVIEQGADEFDRLFESIDKSNGAAREMANIQLDNLAGDITLLQSAVDGMKISVMKNLDPYLRKGVQWLTSKVPMLTEKLSSFANTALEKGAEIKDFLTGVFQGADFKNANGFAEKLFVAFDKIIAEPFQKWWDSNGRDMILNAMSKIGENLGKVYHGIISGIFAALKGEEIDFEGLNLTGLAKAGAETAKTFIESFKSNFDLGGLIGEMPGFLKGALIGYGAIKIGGGAIGILRTIGQLKLAFTGLPVAATSAGASIASVGAKAAKGTGLLTKLGTGLKTVASGLASIPTWGWVAAAAITAVAIGISAYTKAQEDHRQKILHIGDAAVEAYGKYEESVKNVREATDTIEKIKELELKIKQNKGENEAVVQAVKQQIETLQGKQVAVEVTFARGGMTEEEYNAEIEKLKAKKIEIIAELNDSGYNQATVKAIMDQYNGIEAGQKEVALTIAAKTNISAEQIGEYVTQLTELMGKKTQYEIMIEAHGMTPDQVKALKDDLVKIQEAKAELEIKINKGQGSMTDQEWNDLVTNYNELTTKAGIIQLQIEGAGKDDKQIAELKEELGKIRGEAAAILLNIGYDDSSTMKQEDMDKLASLFGEIGIKEMKLKISLADGSLTPDQIKETKDALDAMYERLAEMSGGAFTAEDLKSGKTNVEQVQDFLQKKADYDMVSLQYAIETEKANVKEAVANRDRQKGLVEEYSGYEQQAGGIASELKLLEQDRKTLNKQRDIMKGRLDRGDMTASDYNAWYWGEYSKGLGGLQDKYTELTGDVAPTLGALMSDESTGFDASQYEKEANQWKANKEAALAQYDTQTQSLMNLYQMEKNFKQAELFNGTEYSGNSIEDMANSFTTLDEAGRAAFENALQGLDEVNKAADYIAESEKTSIADILTSISDKANAEAVTDVLGTVQGKLTEIAETYSNLTDEQAKADFNEDNIKAVNEALSALNLGEIENLGELGDKLGELGNIDVSKLDFSAAASSASALGESSDAAKAKLEQVKTAVDALAKKFDVTLVDNAAEVKGKIDSTKASADALAGSYSIHFTISTSGKMPEIPAGGTVTAHSAYGGIFDGAFLSWVAEDGPEAIIPLGSDKRSRGLDLWLQAGRALGVTEFADGGLMAPYTGLFEALPEGGDYDLPSTGSGSSGNKVIQVNAEVNPVFQIEGSDGEDILDKLKSKQRELAELFGGAIADQLEDIVSNMI